MIRVFFTKVIQNDLPRSVLIGIAEFPSEFGRSYVATTLSVGRDLVTSEVALSACRSILKRSGTGHFKL